MDAPEYSVFRPEEVLWHQPGRQVSFGPYLPTVRIMEARGALRYVREGGEAGYSAAELEDMEHAARWTRWINALSQDRKWVKDRLFARLNPMLADGIAIALVPSHDPYRTHPPLREVAQRLAATGDRVDATGCLQRQTKIKRISFGGPSYRSLHRQTITIVSPELLEGRCVLLLDDIIRSGASLRACEEMIYEAGAVFVQSAALGSVVRG